MQRGQQCVKPELTLTKEHQDGAKPLHHTHDVAKQNNGAEDGKELPRGGDDGAGQRAKIHHRHEDEGLVKEFRKKQKNIKKCNLDFRQNLLSK